MPGTQEETTTEETAAKVVPSQEATEKEETTSSESENGETEQEESQELDLGDLLEKTDDGYLMKIGTSVYKGKSPKEVFENWKKGTEEKDRTILEFKTKSTIQPQKQQKEEAVKVSAPPDGGKIVADVFKRYGVDPSMATWDNAKWAEHQDEQGMRDWEIAKLQRTVDKAREEADKRYDEASIEYGNELIMDSATRNIQETLVELSLEPTEYVELYREVLDDVYKKHRDGKGLLQEGKIETEFYKRLHKATAPKLESKLRKEIEDKIAEARDKKKEVVNPGSGTTKVTKSVKQPQSLDEAKAELLKEVRTGKR